MSADIGDFSINPFRRWKKTIYRATWLYKALGLVVGYALCVVMVRFLSLALITYFSMSPSSHLQDINDIFSSNEVTLMGLGSLISVMLIWQLNPISSTRLSDIISRERIEKNLFSGFLTGALLTGFIIVGFLFFGVYRYFGYFIQFSDAPLELANTLLRMVSLVCLAYCEEFIFRDKLLRYFKGEVPDWIAAQVIALFYCGIKVLQFDLGTMHLLTLYLVSLSLFYHARQEGRFAKGAGFWAGVLIVLQPLASLPIFGNDFTGILMIKYQGIAGLHDFRHLTGGAGGPISSMIFQIFLILDIVWVWAFKGRNVKQG